MAILFGALISALYFFTNPVVLVLWIAILLFLIILMERKIRHIDRLSLHTKHRFSHWIIPLSLVHCLLLFIFLLHVLAGILTYSQFTAEVQRTKVMAQSTDKNQEGTRRVFTQIFPYAERCSSTGSTEDICKNEFIKKEIQSALAQLPDTYTAVPYRFVRFALNDRLEFLYPDSGIFQSYPAHDIKEEALHRYLYNPNSHTQPVTIVPYFAPLQDEKVSSYPINVPITNGSAVLGVFQFDYIADEEARFSHIPFTVIMILINPTIQWLSSDPTVSSSSPNLTSTYLVFSGAVLSMGLLYSLYRQSTHRALVSRESAVTDLE